MGQDLSITLAGVKPPLPWLTAALTYSCERVRELSLTLADFPERTAQGRWLYTSEERADLPGWWVGGHWVGLLWQAFAYTNDPALETAARQWAAKLVPRQHDLTTHDLGFLFEPSHVLGARLTGDAALKAPALTAAATLLRRFNPRGNYFQAWGALDDLPELRGRAIIDTMMNLNLLFWASAETRQLQFAECAAAHARTTLRHQVRRDWSTAHVADYNPETGVFIKQATHQGLSPASCWSRGQAWAIYGFGDCYRATHDPLFLESARHLAEYALRRAPEDHVPFWDYDSPLIPDEARDSSAAAALASALLRLTDLETDSAGAGRWRAAAQRILESLWLNYSSRGTAAPSILLHGTRSKPHGLHDHGLIYGDYYFVEALRHLHSLEK
jgi:unsaturated chondroitin disaccharide hydrolase